MDKRGVVVPLSAGVKRLLFSSGKYPDWIGGPLILLLS